MLKRRSINQFIFILTSILILIASNNYISKYDFLPNDSSPQSTNHTLRPETIKLISLGNERAISSLLWVTTLLFSDSERVSNTQNSWMYNRFYTISKLDPLFYENYLFGGIYLSIIKDDVVNAANIFERGLIFYPEDYKILYFAAFNYFFEMGDSSNAIRLYKRLLQNPEAKRYKILPSLIAKIIANEGDKTTALNFLLNAYHQMPEGITRKKSHDSIYSLRAEIDLDCLNSFKDNNSGCNKIDFENNPYILKNGKYIASKKWIKFNFSQRVIEKIEQKKGRLAPPSIDK